MSPLASRRAARIAAGQPRILAIDPGRTTGWAGSDRGTGVLDLTKEYAEDRGFALAAFDDWLCLMFQSKCFDVLAIERPFGRLAGTEWPLILTANAHAIAWRYEVLRAEYSAAQIRSALSVNTKGLVGAAKRRATDAQIMHKVRAAGFNPHTDHEADAAAVLLTHERAVAIAAKEAT